MATDYVTGWEHGTGTDYRTGRPVVRRTPHAVQAVPGIEAPAAAACGRTVDELGTSAFPPTRSMASGQEPCGVCTSQVGRP